MNGGIKECQSGRKDVDKLNENVGEDICVFTQPSQDDLNSMKEQKAEGKKNKNGGIVWGPIKAQRRNQRNLGDDRTGLEKAQELKKIANLEIPRGKTKILTITYASLLSVAADIGILVDSSKSDNSHVEGRNVVNDILGLNSASQKIENRPSSHSSSKFLGSSSESIISTECLSSFNSSPMIREVQDGVSVTQIETWRVHMKWMTLGKVGLVQSSP